MVFLTKGFKKALAAAGILGVGFLATASLSSAGESHGRRVASPTLSAGTVSPGKSTVTSSSFVNGALLAAEGTDVALEQILARAGGGCCDVSSCGECSICCPPGEIALCECRKSFRPCGMYEWYRPCYDWVPSCTCNR